MRKRVELDPETLKEMAELVEVLGQQREVQGKTQAQVAEACGASVVTISFVETGRTRDPCLSTIVIYARALGLKLALVKSDEISQSLA